MLSPILTFDKRHCAKTALDDPSLSGEQVVARGMQKETSGTSSLAHVLANTRALQADLIALAPPKDRAGTGKHTNNCPNSPSLPRRSSG